jgi:hypothetical protein
MLIQSWTCEAAHAQLALDPVRVIHERLDLLRTGKLAPLPAASQAAAGQAYESAATKLVEGLEAVIKSDKGSADPVRR